MKMRLRRLPWLIILTVGIVLCLIISPATRWIMKYQVKQIFSGGSNVLYPITINTDAIARTKPDDLEIQTAAVTMSFDTYDTDYGIGGPVKVLDVSRLRLIRAYTDHFHDNPAACANAMRLLCSFDAIQDINVTDMHDNLTALKDPSNIKTLAEYRGIYKYFLTLAKNGEKLDPANAYFPFLSALGLIGEHRDKEALDAIIRAGKMPKWDEYLQYDISGRTRICDQNIGVRCLIFRSQIWKSIMSPHYSKIRSLERMGRANAIEMEKSGGFEQGLSIRVALQKVGGLMRTQSTSMIGCLVGRAVSSLSINKPCGVLLPKAWTNSTENESARIDEYCRYLIRIGHTDEITNIYRQIRLNDQVQMLANQDVPNIRKLLPIFYICWILALILFFNIISMYIVYFSLKLLRTLKVIKNREPLSKSGIIGMISALAVLVTLTIYTFQMGAQYLIAIISTLSAICLIIWVNKKYWSAIIPGFKYFVGSFLSVGIVLFAQIMLMGYTGNIMHIWTADDYYIEEFTYFIYQHQYDIAIYVPPALIHFVFITTLIKREPLVSGLVHRMYRASMSTICVLTLLWCSTIIVQAVMEMVQCAKSEAMTYDEPGYLAKELNQSWPGRPGN